LRVAGCLVGTSAVVGIGDRLESCLMLSDALDRDAVEELEYWLLLRRSQAF
jgi:hypothetical protein